MNEPSSRSADPFAHYDAAYVLGSLSTEDHAAFERHMSSCDGCARAVRELAGVPGLLARADAPTGTPEPPPRRLLPTLAARARRKSRLRRTAAVTATVLALAAGVALILALTLPQPRSFAGTPMAVLGDYPVHGSVTLSQTQNGTRVEMSCGYEGGRTWDYVLVLVPRDGTADTLATWSALPGERVRISVASGMDRADIGAVEVRTPQGKPVLRYVTDG